MKIIYVTEQCYDLLEENKDKNETYSHYIIKMVRR